MSLGFHPFQWKDADYRLCGKNISILKSEIKQQRHLLENYIQKHSEFKTSFKPVAIDERAPLIARRMAHAAKIIGTGPMAAVAGTIAQMAVEKSLEKGACALIENGGDIYAALDRAITIGLYPGKNHRLTGKLALKIRREDMPVSICSSSSKMGHSLSFGDCDLVTILAEDASLADAAATMACNRVKSEEDVDKTLCWLESIGGLRAAVIIKDLKIGLWGDLPPIVKNLDASMKNKVTRHQRAFFE